MDAGVAAAAPGFEVVQVPIAFVDDHPRNRGDGDLGDLRELTESIQAVGVLQPVIVVPSHRMREAAGEVDPVPDGRYVLVVGHRRKHSSIAAGLTTLPCVVRDDLAGVGGRVAAIIENAHRRDLTPIQEALLYQELVDEGLSQRDVADRVGCNQSQVSRRLALLKLPRAVQEMVAKGEVSTADAGELVALAKVTTNVDVFKRVLSRAGTWEGVAGAVRSELAASRRDAEVREVKAKLKADGVTVVKYPTYGMWRSDSDQVPLARLVEQKLTTPGKHRKLGCHAAAVDTDLHPRTPGNRVVYVCTDPVSHGLAQPEPVAPRDEEREAFDAAATEARERRTRFLADLLAGPTPPSVETYVLSHFLTQALPRGYNAAGDLRAVAALLGRPDDYFPPAPETTSPYDVAEQYRARLFDDAARGQRKGLIQTLAAAVLHQRSREAVRYAGSTAASANGLEFLRLLAQLGYDLTELEHQELAYAQAPRCTGCQRTVEELAADGVVVPAPDGPEFVCPDPDCVESVCRECGCTDDRGCEQGCSWVEPGLCSACAPAPDGELTVEAAAADEVA